MVDASAPRARRGLRPRARCRRRRRAHGTGRRRRRCRDRARRRASTCCSATTRGCARGLRRSSANGPYAAARMAARRLDHDHVGAEVAEHLAGERGVLRRQLDDAQPVERSADRSSPRDGPPASRTARSRSRHAVLGQLLDLVVVETEDLRQHLSRVCSPGTGRCVRSTSRSPTGGWGCRRRARHPSRGGAPSATDPTRSSPGRGRSDPRGGRPPPPVRPPRATPPRS